MYKSGKLRYWLWAMARALSNDSSCPFCGSAKTRLLRRKALVTALVECDECGLRFRTPKDESKATTEFYQTRYREGFTTELPGSAELNFWITNGFKNSPKDYTSYLAVLQAVGLTNGSTILDFGCSWGYGSWQMQAAGYQVYSYEISRPRAQFASEYLGCRVITDVQHIPERVACVFSAHVMEHLPDPKVFWQAVNISLAPGGVVVCFMPNGEPSQEQRMGTLYHQLWGQAHPLLLTRSSLRAMSKSYGFQSQVFSSPYFLDGIRQAQEDEVLTGDELLLVAQQR